MKVQIKLVDIKEYERAEAEGKRNETERYERPAYSIQEALKFVEQSQGQFRYHGVVSAEVDNIQELIALQDGINKLEAITKRYEEIDALAQKSRALKNTVLKWFQEAKIKLDEELIEEMLVEEPETGGVVIFPDEPGCMKLRRNDKFVRKVITCPVCGEETLSCSTIYSWQSMMDAMSNKDNHYSEPDYPHQYLHPRGVVKEVNKDYLGDKIRAIIAEEVKQCLQ